ncbi:hypothetical protein [Candidatus Methylacidithermus pantelleriae]|uniref:Uncharacterized protein n=1 Tax=Candidatus Methylacidithermus pantelleriae TaxID=2744239 RepID=A0A8J2BR98_9BACT|nr:hypothetical protein [Candidatus Methylacidithermus pantelleriae]CAF0701002.1 hypothetical protein MPNT_40104 [Candidatus Methylacidithermus pantelleriae]
MGQTHAAIPAPVGPVAASNAKTEKKLYCFFSAKGTVRADVNWALEDFQKGLPGIFPREALSEAQGKRGERTPRPKTYGHFFL